jgi:hypothetical protein
MQLIQFLFAPLMVLGSGVVGGGGGMRDENMWGANPPTP